MADSARSSSSLLENISDTPGRSSSQSNIKIYL